MDVPPPSVLKQPLEIPYKTLMGPGPSNCSPRVLHALSQPVLGHMDPKTFKIMDEIKEGLKYVFQTRNELTLTLSTSGHGAMEAVLCNLLEPGDKALIAVHGFWGTRAADMARRYGAVVNTVQPRDSSDTLSLIMLEKAIEKHKPKLLFITHGESSTGICQPLEGLGDICRRYDCLLVVDTVASLGGTPLFTDKWKIDAIYSGSQKVLGAPPGLAPISFSPRAQEVIFKRKIPVKVFYWDMKILGQQWNCFNNVRPYHHTVSANLLYALREGLAIIAEEGLEKTIRRHQECASLFYEGLEQLGLEFFVEEEHKRLPTVTTIKVPENLDWKRVIAYAMTNYSLDIAGGLGPTTGKAFRIGLMGYNATPEKVSFLLKVLEEALEHAKNSRSKL